MSELQAYHLDSLNHLGPVCALALLDNKYIMSGEGPTLKIYNYITGAEIFSRIIFSRNKIHGITLMKSSSHEETIIAVWGGRSLAIFTIKELEDLNRHIEELSVGDWIFHCIFSNSKMLNILTAHNIVHIVSLEPKPELINSQHCNWKSILYSGTLHIDSKTQVVHVLAGTVMNGILTWNVSTGEVKHNLTNHEGSIFCVIPSPDGKYIVSCSDDRSIKVWSSETGELLANGWGHGARIWDLTVYDVDINGFKIWSASEDCTARIWQFNKSTDDLKQERIVLGHTGRNVWSATVNDELKIGFTGGADGKILVHDLAESNRVGYCGNKWELKDISSGCGCKFAGGEIVKEYADFGFGLFAVTSTGKVLVLKDFKEWKLLFEDNRFERFSIIRGYERHPIVILGNKLGDIIIIKFNEECEVVEKKEISFSDKLSRLGNILILESSDKLQILLESPNPNEPLLFLELNPKSLEVKSAIELVKPNEKIVVSAIEYDPINDYLIIGCRFATILLYILSKSTEPVVMYKNLVKGDTISFLKLVPNPQNSSSCTFYLTSKDCNYYIVEINPNLELGFVQNSKIQKGFLEGLLKMPNGDVIFYGFKSDSFFVWNETKQFEIKREICGGPHRRWAFRYWIDNKDNLRFRFIYTRASEVQIVEKGEFICCEVLATGLHGREIRDMCVVDIKNNEDEKILITGAEDTTLKISTITKNGEVKLDWTYREHVSGIQSVHALNEQYIMSSSAREELFLWKLNECDNKKCMALYCTLKSSQVNPDLRIMDFDAVEVKDRSGIAIGFVLITVYSDSNIKVWYFNYEAKEFKIIIDDYYQRCCIFNVKFLLMDNKMYVLIGSTNGHISIYDISESIDKYFIVVPGMKLGNYHLLLNSNSEKKFSFHKLTKLLVNQQLHQSSIQDLDFVQKGESLVYLVTGGDDNALVVSKIIKINDTVNIEVESFDPSAASSTITSVSMVDDNTVIVGAVDQSIKLWNISDGLSLVNVVYTTVADTGCTEVAKFNDGTKLALVGGAGFSIWKM